MAYAFSTQGSTPMATSSLTGKPTPGYTTGSTPASNALNVASMVAPSSASAAVTKAPTTQTTTPSTPYNASIAPVTAGLIPKSQTINNVDGSSHTVTYHAPDVQPDASIPLGSTANPQIPSASTGQGLIQTSIGNSNSGLTDAQKSAARTPEQIAQEQASQANSGSTTGMLAPQSGTPSVGTNPTPASVGGLLGNLALNPNPEIQSTIDTAAKYKADVGTALKTVGNTPGPLGNQLGRESNINSAAALQEQANAEKIQALQNLQSTQQSGLASAGGLLNPSNNFTQVSPGNIAINSQGETVAAGPQLGQPGQQYYNPGPGSTSNGFQLTGAPATDIANLSQAAADGKIGYDAALSQLSGYGTAVQNQLLPAIQKLKPDFNVSLSNAGVGTVKTGQELLTAANSANQALDTLSTAFNSLGGTQTGGIPLTNSIANWIGTNLGQSALTSYKTALADARSQLVGVLSNSGGTPTGNESTAEAYLPDNMTVGQFNQNVGSAQNPGVVRTLIQQKVNSFTGSGQQGNQPQNASSNSSSIYSF